VLGLHRSYFGDLASNLTGPLSQPLRQRNTHVLDDILQLESHRVSHLTFKRLFGNQPRSLTDQLALVELRSDAVDHVVNTFARRL
jgi:hypothetical protein